MLTKLALTREAATDLYVPSESLSSKNPATHPAFFNPAARLNRDLSVALAAATRPTTFLDALAGTGARGVRIAKEASTKVRVTFVEFNRSSMKISKMNAKLNGVTKRCSFVHSESNAFLHSRYGRPERFDAVDIDPFGTPAPYVQGALSATADGGMLSVTATDTATLCGVYPMVALRRYGARLTKTEFPHETGLRVLMGFCARVAGTIDMGVEPVAAHSNLHYLRLYFRPRRGAASADRSVGRIGHVTSCKSCHQNSVTESQPGSCPRCGGKASSVGPQWVGDLVDPTIVRMAAEHSRELGLSEAETELKAIQHVNSFPPFGYSMEEITSREGVSSVSFRRVADSLEASGLLVARNPFERSGLKTSASYEQVSAAVRASAR